MTYKFAHKVTTIALIISVMTFVVPVAVNANFVSVPPKDTTTVEEPPVVYVGGNPPKDDTTVEENPTTTVKPPKDDTTVEEPPVINVNPPKDDTTVEEPPVVTNPPKDDTTVEEEEPPIIVVAKKPLNVSCTPSKSTVKIGETVSYQMYVSGGQTPYQYSWNYHSPDSYAPYSTSFSSTGNKVVYLTVIDDDGDQKTVGCSSVTVVSNPLPPVDNDVSVSCTASNTVINAGQSVTFTSHTVGGDGNITYSWSGAISGNTSNISKTFNSAGTYVSYVTVTDVDGDVSNATCPTVTVKSVVVPPVDHDVNVTCSVSKNEVYVNEITAFTANVSGGDGTITYKWSGAISGSSATQNAQFSSAGTKVAYITVTDVDGDVSTATCNTVKVKTTTQPPVDHDVSVSCSVSKTNVSVNESTTFTANANGGDGVITYSWNGAVSGNTSSISKSFTSAGTKVASVTVTDADGDTDTVICNTVNVKNVIDIPVDHDVTASCVVSKTSVEKGEIVTFTANTNGGDGTITYDWNGAIDGTSRTQNAQFSSAGTKNVSVTVTDADGDKDTSLCTTVVVREPVIDYDDIDVSVSCTVSKSIVDKNEVVTFTAHTVGGNGSLSYNWNGAINGTGSSQNAKFTSAGTKTASVVVTDADGDKDTAVCQTITVKEPVITHNDTDISVTCRVSDTVVDKQEIVTFTADISGGDGTITYDWDGAIDGDDQSESVYFNKAGTKVVSVRVTDADGDTDTSLCSTVTVEDEIITHNDTDVSVTCQVSDTNVEENDQVTYTADTVGGDGDLTYIWNGSVSGTHRTETVRYTSEGTKSASVTVIDEDGDRDTATCATVYVEDDYNNEDFDVTCRVSDTSVEEDEYVTYSVDIRGGNGSFDYDWDGDISGDDSSERVRFSNEGTQRVDVTVTDRDGNQRTDSCPNVRVENDDDDDLRVTCRVSDTSVRRGDRVTYTAEVDGGNSPFDYDWDGDISGNDRRESVEFDDRGRMVVRVTVEDDDGNEDSDTCPTVRVDDDKIIYSTGGSNVSSVFLSQVPYTGPAEVLKGIGFTLLLLIWSVLSVHLYRQKRSKKVQSEKIEAFRALNKKATVLA